MESPKVTRVTINGLALVTGVVSDNRGCVIVFLGCCGEWGARFVVVT